MVGGQYNASTLSCLDQLVGLGGVECQRFLAQDMLTRSDRSHRLPVVRGVDARNVHALTRGSPSARSRSSWPSAPNTPLRPWRDCVAR